MRRAFGHCNAAINGCIEFLAPDDLASALSGANEARDDAMLVVEYFGNARRRIDGDAHALS